MKLSTQRVKENFLFQVLQPLYKKYHQDNGHIIVASIAFYVLLTFIPFTLMSLYILGHVIELSNPGLHLEKFLKNIIPDPYSTIVVKRVMQEMNVISLSKKLSGPLGLIFLLFFTTRLFSVIRVSFRIIFGKHPERFIKGKGKELFFTLIFSIFNALLFFSFIFSIVIQTKATRVLPQFVGKTPFIILFSLLDIFFTFCMFYFLYYFLSPVRRKKKALVVSTLFATLFWHLGRLLFKHYILYLGRFTSFFGTYGVFIAFLFWIYFSVFVFIICAELQSVLLAMPGRGLQPSSSHTREKPSGERKG